MSIDIHRPYLIGVPSPVIKDWLLRIINKNYRLSSKLNELAHHNTKGKVRIMWDMLNAYFIKDDISVIASQIHRDSPGLSINQLSIDDLAEEISKKGISNIQIEWSFHDALLESEWKTLISNRGYHYLKNSENKIILIYGQFYPKLLSPINESEYITFFGMEPNQIWDSIKNFLQTDHSLRLPDSNLLQQKSITLITFNNQYLIESDIIYDIYTGDFGNSEYTNIDKDQLTHVLSKSGLHQIEIQYEFSTPYPDTAIGINPEYFPMIYRELGPGIQNAQYYDGRNWIRFDIKNASTYPVVYPHDLSLIYDQEHTMQMFIGG